MSIVEVEKESSVVGESDSESKGLNVAKKH